MRDAALSRSCAVSARIVVVTLQKQAKQLEINRKRAFLNDDNPMLEPTRIHVSIVDDHPTILRGLVALFREDPRFEIVSMGSDAGEIRKIALEGRSDVIVVDLSMPGDVFETIEDIAHRRHELKLVVFTAYADVDLAIRAFEAGAHAFVLKGSASEELYEAIETVRRGDLYVSSNFSAQVLAGFRRKASEPRKGGLKLSRREEQVVRYLQQGKTNKEIAAALNLTEKTVKHYMTNLMAKMQVKSRLEVVLESRKWLPTQVDATWSSGEGSHGSDETAPKDDPSDD